MATHVTHDSRRLTRRSIAGTALALAALTLATAPLIAQGGGGRGRGGAGAGAAQGPMENVDTVAIAKIKDEGFKRSQIMNIMSWLTDVYGPRLTGSPITKKAADWTVAEMTRWGITNPHIEWWTGPRQIFGRGWVNDKTSVQVTSPVAFPVIAYPAAWSDGLTAPVTGAPVVYVPLQGQVTSADFAPYRGKLKGAVVISAPEPNVQALFTAPGTRYTFDQLDAMASSGNPFPVTDLAAAGRGGRGGRGGGGGGRGAGRGAGAPGAAAPAPPTSPLVNLTRCFLDEGAVAILSPASGNGGNVFTASASPPVPGGNVRAPDAPRGLPQLSLAAEHYGRIFRIVQKGVPVKMDLDVRNTFYPAELKSFNVVGEIPGTDKRDELVMLGGHFDSWQGGTGATDNAAGSAVMLEALRILKTLNLPMRRTVRIGLWTGEEQGLIGSNVYVREHFGYSDSTGFHAGPEHAKLSGYYNVDNGTGAIRGIYLQGNAAEGPIFSQWMRPLNSDSISVGHIAAGNTGGTDHQSFDAVSLPGFQFIQDAIEYGSRTHHSSQDVYERIQAPDMRHNAVVVATFVYLTANRDDLLPRKPLPAAGGGRGGGGGGGGRGGAGTAPTTCPR